MHKTDNRIVSPYWVLLNAGYETVGKEWNYKNVCSPFLRIYYVTAGEGYIEYSDRTIVLQPGKCYIVPAFTMHSNRCDGSMSHYYLHVYEDYAGLPTLISTCYVLPDSLETLPGMAQLFNDVISINSLLSLKEKDPTCYDTYSNLQSRLENDSRRPIADRMINNGVISLIMGWWIKEGKDKTQVSDDRIIKVLEYVQNHLFEKISVDDCAKIASLSKYHFVRKFKDTVGMSLINYVNFLRMRRAQSDLAFTAKNIKCISNDLGYEDVNYFTRIFHKQTGMTPSAYRQQCVTPI